IHEFTLDGKVVRQGVAAKEFLLGRNGEAFFFLVFGRHAGVEDGMASGDIAVGTGRGGLGLHGCTSSVVFIRSARGPSPRTSRAAQGYQQVGACSSKICSA